MRALTSFIRSHPRLQRMIELLGIKAERLGRWIQRRFRQSRGDLIENFSDHAGSNFGRFDLTRSMEGYAFTKVSMTSDKVQEMPGFIRKILNIEGVVKVHLEPYRLGIIKASYADWEEIKTDVKLVLDEEFWL